MHIYFVYEEFYESKRNFITHYVSPEYKRRRHACGSGQIYRIFTRIQAALLADTSYYSHRFRQFSLCVSVGFCGQYARDRRRGTLPRGVDRRRGVVGMYGTRAWQRLRICDRSEGTAVEGGLRQLRQGQPAVRLRSVLREERILAQRLRAVLRRQETF